MPTSRPRSSASSGEPVARPTVIAGAREVATEIAVTPPGIAELSHLAIRHADERPCGRPRPPWGGGEFPGRATETYPP